MCNSLFTWINVCVIVAYACEHSSCRKREWNRKAEREPQRLEGYKVADLRGNVMGEKRKKEKPVVMLPA